MKKNDERDTMFSRMNLKKDSETYQTYYKRRPDLKEKDDYLRSLPPLGSTEGKTYDALNSPIVDAAFQFLGDIKTFAEGEPAKECIDVDPEVLTKKIKGLAKYYGAKIVGVTKMEDYHYYSYRGRHAENYGEPIQRKHKYGIVFAVEMEKEMIFKAPLQAESIAVTKGYVDAAVIGMMVAYYIRALGYASRNHMDGNYLVIAPVVAHDAGVGEMGRNGLLITKKYGPRVRLGVVTTDAELIVDTPRKIGVEKLCQACQNCAYNCPVQAIDKSEKVNSKTKKWQVDHEKCFGQWLKLGSDCGVCIASCPLSDSVPAELIDQMQENEEAMTAIITAFKEKNGKRAFNKEKIDWIDE